MSNAYNTIVLKGTPRYEEAVASGITKPGKLIKLDNAGKVLNHATQGGPGERAFAIEDALQGKSIDDAYAVGDLVPYVVAAPGDVIFAFVDDGETIVKGDFMQSSGDGNLEKRTSTNSILAIAEDAIDLAQTGDVETRIAVRVV